MNDSVINSRLCFYRHWYVISIPHK